MIYLLRRYFPGYRIGAQSVNTVTIFVLLMLCVIGFLACQEPTGRESIPVTKRAVLTAIDKYDQAWREKDTAAVSSIMAKEYLYFSSRGGVRSRSWLLNDLLGNPSYRIDSLYRNDLEVKLYNDAAVVGSRWQGYGSYRGTKIEDHQRCSLVFVFEEGLPYLAAEHCTDLEN